MSGKLSAIIDDDHHVQFHLEFASDDYSHAFTIECYHGMKVMRHRNGAPVIDANGDQVMEEDWRPIHTGVRKFIQGTPHDFHKTRLPDGHPDEPLMRAHGSRKHKYRALAFKDISDMDRQEHERVTMLETHGEYSNIVEI